MDTILLVLLIIFCALILLTNIAYFVYRFLKGRLYRARIKARRAERSTAVTEEKAEDELPEEVLVAIITAAVTSLYKKKKNTRFRVVSFGRTGQNKNSL